VAQLLTVTRRLAWEKRRAVCAVCGGPIFQRYDGGPWLHVNLDDYARTNPHNARPVVEDDPESREGTE
jgi:hypothetical protein